MRAGLEEGSQPWTGKPWKALQGEVLLTFGFKSLQEVNAAREGLGDWRTASAHNLDNCPTYMQDDTGEFPEMRPVRVRLGRGLSALPGSWPLSHRADNGGCSKGFKQ